MVLPSCSLSFVPPGLSRGCSATLSLTPLPPWEYLSFAPSREDVQPESSGTNTPESPGMALTALVTPSELHFLLHQTAAITKGGSVRKKPLFYTLFYIDIKPKLSFIMYRR